MHIHNPNISNEIRLSNKIYNENFIKEIGLNKFKKIQGTINRKDWELRGFNVFETVWLKNIDRTMIFIKELGLNIQEYNLLDIGSGNGIACIYFYFKFKFKKVIGVEICKDLYKQSILFSPAKL